MRFSAFASRFQPGVYANDHRLHRPYKMVGAEQHLGGGDEVRRVATRLRAAMNIAYLKMEP
jgi:hypothetical protein